MTLGFNAGAGGPRAKEGGPDLPPRLVDVDLATLADLDTRICRYGLSTHLPAR